MTAHSALNDAMALQAVSCRDKFCRGSLSSCPSALRYEYCSLTVHRPHSAFRCFLYSLLTAVYTGLIVFEKPSQARTHCFQSAPAIQHFIHANEADTLSRRNISYSTFHIGILLPSFTFLSCLSNDLKVWLEHTEQFPCSHLSCSGSIPVRALAPISKSATN